MTRAQAHAVRQYGEGEPVLVLGHGIGGGQDQWEPVVRHFRGSARVVTFALAGAADADPALFSPGRHASLLGYADDLAMLCSELGLRGAVYVGHSLSAMAGALAAAADPGLFSRLILLNASARYVDDPATGYVGGFSQQQVEDLLTAMAGDFVGWSSGFAAAVMGNPARPVFAEEFARSLRAYSPEVAAIMFRTAFTCDFRSVMPRVLPPTLLLQNAADLAVPPVAAQWLEGAMANASLRVLAAEGHFPHVVAPAEVIAAIEAFGFPWA